MMHRASPLHRLSAVIRRHRLVAAVAAVALLGGAAIASAAIVRRGPTPPPAPLATAVHRALTAPAVPGVTARIRFVNRLVSSGALPAGTSSPLLSGAEGRAWVSGDGRFRLELQSSQGDTQIVSDGRRLTLYDGRSNTLYRARLPRARSDGRDHRAIPSLADVRRALGRLAGRVGVSPARPTNVAGRPAYEVRLSPRRDGGLLAALSLAWDSEHGVPLRLAVTARGSDRPVLELEATDVSYGAVSDAVLSPPAPAGAKVVRVDLPWPGAGELTGREGTAAATRVARKRLAFGLNAPRRLLGRSRRSVRIVGGRRDAHARAIVLYGRGLDGLAVLEAPGSARPARELARLQRVSIGGATGHELPTALGTLLTWDSGGVRYTLVGSVPATAAEAAARELMVAAGAR